MGVGMTQLIQRHSRLEDRATRDQLTGVLNREGFTSQANDLLDQGARYGVGFAVVYMDIDRFKAINDTFGHELGDRALKNTATRIRDAARRQDLLGRMGGDEFVLLLYDCRAADAEQITRRILSQVAAEPISREKQDARVSLSAGLLYVQLSHQVHSVDVLISAADQLMYQAKQAGGNQVHSRIV